MTTFKLNGTTYTTNEKGNYFYKSTGSKDKKGNDLMMRIGKHVFEQAFDEYINNGHDQGSTWEEADTEYKDRKEAQDKKDAEAEKNFNKKASKPRKSKDIAHSFYNEDTNTVVTLTTKQVDFIKHIPDTCFYENGLESTLWCDILADEIGGQFARKPMTVGAMISTLREKNLIYVMQSHVNGKKAKFFGFTDMGKQVATELGLN